MVVEKILCLDTNFYIKYLAPDEQDPAAIQLVLSANSDRVKIIAPTFAWAELGSVLRKKVRASLITAEFADGYWRDFCTLPIEYIDNQALRDRAWELARSYQLPTLYDAAFLACTEIGAASLGVTGEFWTGLKKGVGERRRV